MRAIFQKKGEEKGLKKGEKSKILKNMAKSVL